MSTGNLNLDLWLAKIRGLSPNCEDKVIEAVKKRYPSLSDHEAKDMGLFVRQAAQSPTENILANLVLTAPPSFSVKAKSTKNTVKTMIENASASILITGYSLSEYFADLTEIIIRKSQTGVLVKFFVNDIENQSSFDKLCRNRGRFLKIYNYRKQEDKMSALHAKVLSVDQSDTLITSANLSYHGQEGNIELGVRIKSEKIAKQLDEIFTQLLFSKIFEEVGK